MNRLLLPAAALTAIVFVAACPGGLNLDFGNAFPCDFSQPEHIRDVPCRSVPPGEWVCGTDNVCRANADEGLQGETPLPTVETPTLVLPTRLQVPVKLVAADPAIRGQFFIWPEGSESALLVSDQGRAFDDLLFAPFGVPANPEELAIAGNVGGNALLVVRAGGFAATVERGNLRSAIGDAFVLDSMIGARDSRGAGPLLDSIEALRVDRRNALLPGIQQPLSLVLGDGTAGETYRNPVATNPPAVYRPLDAGIAPTLADGGPNFIADVRFVSRNLVETTPAPPPSEGQVPVALTRTGLYYREFRVTDGGVDDRWVQLNTGAEGFELPSRAARLRHSRTGTTWAAMLDVGNAKVLSTWLLDRGNPPRMVRAWDDCVPCSTDALAFTPSINGATSVEVLCERGVEVPRRLVSVTGVSANIDQRTGAFFCNAEPFASPIDLSELQLAGDGVTHAVDDTVGDRITFGGKHGQVWSGPTLGTLHPLSLDRVPVALGSFQGQPTAMTEEYVAFPISENGMLAVPMGDILGARATEDRVPAASIGGIEGWAILQSAEIIRVTQVDGGAAPLAVAFGPQLEGASGGAAIGPFAGEAQQGAGGELRIIATAGDGIYQHVVGTLSDVPGEIVAELPQLTPEPGFPIRSLTLDRATPTRPDAGVRVRGYVVTSRNVFDFQLGGAPERWSQRQVSLPAGEPVEVWMDAPKSPLGRVGYRDGTVYTLPGGYLMAQRLPSADDGGVPRVLDFANLNGYPVALTERGVFLSRKDEQAFPDGGTSRILVWDRIPLPPELIARPDRFARGRIESLTQDAGIDPVSGRARTRQVLLLFSSYGFVYRLASSAE